MIEAEHWRDVPEADWPWPHFSPQEMACRRTGRIEIEPELMHKLESLRAALGDKPMIVTSGYRSPEHNRAVGGAKNSQHMLGRAADIMVANFRPNRLIGAAEAVGFRGIGTYPESGFVHLDARNGPEARWGKPFRAGSPEFAPEPPDRSRQKAAKEGSIVVGSAAAAYGGAREVLQETGRYLPEPWLIYAAAAVGVLGLVVVGLRAYYSRRGD